MPGRGPGCADHALSGSASPIGGRRGLRLALRGEHTSRRRRPSGVVTGGLERRHRVLERAPAALRFCDGHPLPALAEPDLRVEYAHPSPSNSRRGLRGRAAPPARTFAQPGVAGITRKGEFPLAADPEVARGVNRPAVTPDDLQKPVPRILQRRQEGDDTPAAGMDHISRVTHEHVPAAEAMQQPAVSRAVVSTRRLAAPQAVRNGRGEAPVVYTRTCRSGASSTYTRVPLGLRLMPWDAAVGLNPGGMGPKLRVAMIRPVRRLPTEKPRKRVHVR